MGGRTYRDQWRALRGNPVVAGDACAELLNGGCMRRNGKQREASCKLMNLWVAGDFRSLERAEDVGGEGRGEEVRRGEEEGNVVEGGGVGEALRKDSCLGV